eukprot:15447757-Alexandrium_andersonii.AAC.1
MACLKGEKLSQRIKHYAHMSKAPAPTYMVTLPSGQNWPRPQNPAHDIARPTRPKGQTAISSARNLQKFGAPHNA